MNLLKKKQDLEKQKERTKELFHQAVGAIAILEELLKEEKDDKGRDKDTSKEETG